MKSPSVTSFDVFVLGFSYVGLQLSASALLPQYDTIAQTIERLKKEWQHPTPAQHRELAELQAVLDFLGQLKHIRAKKEQPPTSG